MAVDDLRYRGQSRRGLEGLMDTAKEKFQIGQRVQMTKEALHVGLDGPRAKRSIGVVVGFPVRGYGNLDLLVRIRRDGEKTIHVYSMDFWEPAT